MKTQLLSELLVDYTGRSAVIPELAPECLHNWTEQIHGILWDVNKQEFGLQVGSESLVLKSESSASSQNYVL